MGCGRSTMGSDSPSRNSKTDEEDGDTPQAEISSKTNRPNTVSHPVIPFSPGGPLLAQAKASDSLVDFLKVLDEKIDNGPDYDSESEAVSEKSRLQLYLEQWTKITKTKNAEVRRKEENASLIEVTPSAEVKCLVVKPVEEEIDEWSDPENISHETVKEQYMFMGNLYTLTRLRSDGTHAHHVDISPAPYINDISQSDEASLIKINGTCKSESVGKVKRTERKDTSVHQTITKPRMPPRPASLVLRTVFPNCEES